jgi:hypothetical protein
MCVDHRTALKAKEREFPASTLPNLNALNFCIVGEKSGGRRLAD